MVILKYVLPKKILIGLNFLSKIMDIRGMRNTKPSICFKIMFWKLPTKNIPFLMQYCALLKYSYYS